MLGLNKQRPYTLHTYWYWKEFLRFRYEPTVTRARSSCRGASFFSWNYLLILFLCSKQYFFYGYRYNTACCRIREEISRRSANCIVTLSDPRVLELLDLKIFAEADADLCLSRRRKILIQRHKLALN